MVINTEMLMQDLIALRDEMHKLTQQAHGRTKEHPIESSWWNFYVGQTDGRNTARYKLQQLIEKYT